MPLSADPPVLFNPGARLSARFRIVSHESCFLLVGVAQVEVVLKQNANARHLSDESAKMQALYVMAVTNRK
jgi:hypothetical protein